MKALSIMQPWAWLIVNGHKDVENRSWPTRYRGPLLIHAGKKLDGETHQALLKGRHPVTGRPLNETLRLAYTLAVSRGLVHRGGIVGQAAIVGCVDRAASPWFVGEFGFLLRDAKPLSFAPCAGQLGFFTPVREPDLFSGDGRT